MTADNAQKLTGEALREAVAQELASWEDGELAAFLARAPETRSAYHTASGRPVDRVYTPADLDGTSFADIGLPGRFPYTRGPYPTMYRGRLWTMRQIAGFGTPAETNERFQYLIAQGQTGLSVDFDMPTLMGYDSDDEMSYGEVGREGVAIDTIDDMHALFDGVDLGAISVSLTVNGPAWILLAMYAAVAQERGYDLHALSGTIQNDILKEYVAQKEWIYPIRPAMRLVRDSIVWASENMRRYNPINISGYHISEAGATAVQEAAFTMAIARAYADDVTAAGLDIDDFAPRLSFFFVAQRDFFEEVAKFRALRRVWANLVKDRYGAKKPESMRLRFHTQTAAASLTKAQPMNNIVRTALQAMSAVLGGTQSLHTNGLDEAFTIPSEMAMKVALRTQQVIAHESGVPEVIDPLGGSWYVEALTNDMEKAIWEYLEIVDAKGGCVKAIEDNFFQGEIADTAYQIAQNKGTGEHVVVGVNRYVDESEDTVIETHKLDPASERRQIENLGAVKAGRDQAVVARLLQELQVAAKDDSCNLMPLTIEAVKARVSMGEIVSVLKDVWGVYREVPVF